MGELDDPKSRNISAEELTGLQVAADPAGCTRGTGVGIGRTRSDVLER